MKPVCTIIGIVAGIGRIGAVATRGTLGLAALPIKVTSKALETVFSEADGLVKKADDFLAGAGRKCGL